MSEFDKNKYSKKSTNPPVPLEKLKKYKKKKKKKAD